MENLKSIIKRHFMNNPKAKAIACIIGVTVCITGTVTVFELRKTVVVSIDNVESTFVTYKGSVDEVLKENGIEVNEKDKIEPSLDSKLSENEVIKLKKAVPVEIIANGSKIEIDTAEDTVEDMLDVENDYLKENGIDFDKSVDEISCKLNDKVEEGLSVQLTKVETKDIVEKEQIAFDTVIEKDENLESTVKKVKQEGVNGEKEITYKVVYKDGVETKREVKSTKTLSEPTNKVVVQGTALVYASRGANGQSISIKGKKQISCTATAYSGGALTRTGSKPSRNVDGISTIAVDPSVIPLGTKVFVDGYGYAIASDTGGAIKGNKIDVYFNNSDETQRWGIKTVNVTIVAYPGEW